MAETASGALVAASSQVEATGFTTAGAFELIQRAGKLLSQSTLVPKEYQNNMPNCVIALNMAQRLGADPLMVMQNLYLVHGRPGWSAQFLIAAFNQCGRFTSITYTFVGTRGQDSWGCYASSTERATGNQLLGETITIEMARKEGWLGKAGSKWQTMPGQMLRYRAATFLVRATAPEIAMGLHTVDEIEDFAPTRPVRLVTPETLTVDANVTGQNLGMVEEREALIALLEAERQRIGLTELEWNAVIGDAIGETTTLEFADPAVLRDLLSELAPMASKQGR